MVDFYLSHPNGSSGRFDHSYWRERNFTEHQTESIPESPGFSEGNEIAHICVLEASSGLHQKILKILLMIYHQVPNRLEYLKRPGTDLLQYAQSAKGTLKSLLVENFNDENWVIGHEQLLKSWERAGMNVWR